jgi:glycosyltransferase involved in cell wall biosynthesis
MRGEMVERAAGPRRVLMVSYWYPPTPGAAARRVAGLSRHLADHGWEPVILTAGEAEEQPRTGPGRPSVVRVPDLKHPNQLYTPYAGPLPPSRWKEWLRTAIFPDRFFAWREGAVRTGGAMLRRERYDVVWATFPPASAAMVGARLSRRGGLPLVLDLRDPWVGPGGYEPHAAALRRRHERLECELETSAAAVTMISQAMAEDVCARLRLEPERVHVIPNGWDAADCPAIKAGASDRAEVRPARLVHVGAVIQRNRPDLFFDALARHVWKDDARPWLVRFVGNLSPAYVASLGLSDCVETTGMVPHEQAWREVCAADALLLLVGDYVGRWGHNAKVFEYLRSGRPILCLEESPNSADRRLLERLAPQRGVFARLGDATEVLRGIDRVLEMGRATPFGEVDDSEELRRHESTALSRQLAEILTAVAAAPRRS